VRTTLGGKRAAPMENSEQSEQFNAVNDKYWRSRSDSASSADSEARARKQPRTQEDLEEGEIDSKSESDDSDSLDSEADDSILLNIGSKENGLDEGEGYDPERLMPENGVPNGTTATSTSNGVDITPGSPSKEEAFRLFALKYPTAPTSLVDLNKEDLETQSRYVYYDRNIHDLDLKLPVSCIECQTEGHMIDICPTKEVCSWRVPSRTPITILTPHLVLTLRRMEQARKRYLSHLAKMPKMSRTRPRRATMHIQATKPCLRSSLRHVRPRTPRIRMRLPLEIPI
jgi:protein AIR1/2